MFLIIKVLLLIVPFDFFTFKSIYSPYEIKEIIDKHLANVSYFQGISKEKFFTVKRKPKNILWIGFEDYKPIITGKVRGNVNGSKIELISRLGYKVLIIFMLMILVAIYMIVKNKEVDFGVVTFIGIVYLIVLILYKIDLFQDKKFLQELLGKTNS